jgi:hypothetical protein
MYLIISLLLAIQSSQNIYATNVVVNREINLFNKLCKPDTVMITVSQGVLKPYKITEIIPCSKSIYLPERFLRGKARITITDTKLKVINTQNITIL